MGLNVYTELVSLTKSLKLSYFDLQQPYMISEADTHLHCRDEETKYIQIK